MGLVQLTHFRDVEKRLEITADGSHTIVLPHLDEQYHSLNGAVTEAYHVFIRSGLDFFTAAHPDNTPVKILEAGFGTGLNAFITLVEAVKRGLEVSYVSLEAYPLAEEEYSALNYSDTVPQSRSLAGEFRRMHDTPWNKPVEIRPGFTLEKRHADFESLSDRKCRSIVFYDAFSPRVQPELWTGEILSRFYDALEPQGVFVTYCAKGSVRRALSSVGFDVERLPGPPGKREMLRGVKEP